MRNRGFRALSAAALALALVTVPAQAEVGRATDATVAGPMAHIRALQDIADANGGNRAAGTAGYDRSADYVAERLRGAGYDVRFEEFTFPFFEERSPPVLALTPTPAANGEVRTLANSGAGDVAARLMPVRLDLSADTPPGASASGCAPEDFSGFEGGAVALVRRGTCPFQAKVENAAAAGAAGVVIMNEGTSGRTDPFRGTLMRPASIPVVGVSFEHGKALASAAAAPDGAPVRLAVDAVTETRTTRNVLAAVPGEEKRTVVIGAHLDSVREGPGMNDNGSGSAAVLEAALKVAGSPAAARLRFAFWGAEERGLLGSRHHVARLSDDERRTIGLYLNLDMVGSPNFGRFVQGPAAAPETLGGTVRRALVSYFKDRALPVEERTGARPRGVGSDDASFADKGVPTLGLYTGAGEPKSEAHAALFGGTAGRPYDPCYHRACDTVENVSAEVLDEMTAALVHALGALDHPNPSP